MKSYGVTIQMKPIWLKFGIFLFKLKFGTLGSFKQGLLGTWELILMQFVVLQFAYYSTKVLAW